MFLEFLNNGKIRRVWVTDIEVLENHSANNRKVLQDTLYTLNRWDDILRRPQIPSGRWRRVNLLHLVRMDMGMGMAVALVVVHAHHSWFRAMPLGRKNWTTCRESQTWPWRAFLQGLGPSYIYWQTCHLRSAKGLPLMRASPGTG